MVRKMVFRRYPCGFQHHTIFNTITAGYALRRLLFANRADKHNHRRTLSWRRDFPFNQGFVVMSADQFTGSVKALVARHVVSPGRPKLPVLTLRPIVPRFRVKINEAPIRTVSRAQAAAQLRHPLHFRTLLWVESDPNNLKHSVGE